MTRHKNTIQRNARIESESILALLCVVISVNVKATRYTCNAAIHTHTHTHIHTHSYGSFLLIHVQ